MQQTAIRPDTSDQDEDTEFDDLEWELCCSAREASLGFVPFANLDFATLATEMRRRWAEPSEAGGDA